MGNFDRVLSKYEPFDCARYTGKFTDDFDHNKHMVAELTDVDSKTQLDCRRTTDAPPMRCGATVWVDWDRQPERPAMLRPN